MWYIILSMSLATNGVPFTINIGDSDYTISAVQGR